jgi:isoleucyl-tRNA synthetase
VHQADWPGYDPQQIDEALNDEMRLVMRLASLGHAARNQAGIKVRQPLAEAAFSVGRPEEAQALERHADLLSDELNVKRGGPCARRMSGFIQPEAAAQAIGPEI